MLNMQWGFNQKKCTSCVKYIQHTGNTTHAIAIDFYDNKAFIYASIKFQSLHSTCTIVV